MTTTPLLSRRAAISVLAWPLVTLAVAAAADSPAAASQTAAMPAGDPVTVTAVKGFRFKSDTIHATAGKPLTIVFKNEALMSHNLTIYATPAGKTVLAHTPTIQRGKQATITFPAQKAGVYPFWCTVPGHKQAGMIGKVVVK